MIYVKESANSYSDEMLIVPTTDELEDHCTFNRVAIEDFKDGELVFRFELVGSGSFTLTASAFQTCLSRIASSEFVEYCELVNSYWEAQEELDSQQKTVEAFVSGEYNYWDDDRSAYNIVSGLVIATEKTETINHQRWNDKYKLIDDWGYSNWVDVCRVYESLFGIERSHI